MLIHRRNFASVLKLLALTLVGLLALVMQPAADGPASAAYAPAGQPPTAVTSTNGGFQGLMGDADCSLSVNAVDALKLLRFVADLSVAQSEPCPDINTIVPGLEFVWGDVDCNGSVSSVDSLKILRYVADLSVSQTEPCTDIGQPVTPLEGFGNIAGTVVNATNADPLAGATVRLRATTSGGSAAGCTGSILDTDVTDSNGEFDFTDIAADFYDIEVVLEDFLDSCRVNILVLGDTTTTLTVSLSPPLEVGELRIVLSWGAEPSDLDSHLWLPEDVAFEVFFANVGTLAGCPFAALDVDDVTSFGPETITIAQRFDGTYMYAVHNFSGQFGLDTPIRQSGAQVQVFGESGLIASYSVSTSGNGLWWHVFNMDGQTGSITTVNSIGDDPGPYPPFSNGCP